MLKILINAYACSPHTGSEPGMGWNWCVHIAQYCELHIITEGEFRENIEAALPALPQGKNMYFYYNPLSPEIRKMCWNQGDWRFYKHYKNWQKSTLEIAKEIVAKEGIDIIHQLNMVGFREPGYLWKIENIPFVWGPIGGLKQFPIAYLKGAGLKMKLFNQLKNIINICQLKYDQRVNQALKRADLLISSIPDSYRALKKHKGLESEWIPETGCFITEDLPTNRFDSQEFHVVWVGKFDFRKQLTLALKSLAQANNRNIVLNVFGAGNEQQENGARQLAKDLNIETQVVWHGALPNEEIQKAMQKAQLFFFTSVSEETSTVVLEAISNRLPVLCFDACGFGAVIDNQVGRKISLSDPGKSAAEFARELNFLESNREYLKKLSQNCKAHQEKLSWHTKAILMSNLYQRIHKNM